MAARERLQRFLQPYRVYDTDPGLCRLWAEVMNRAHFHGRTMDKADAWIAATALALDAPLVTNNPADFAAVDGLRVWTAAGK